MYYETTQKVWVIVTEAKGHFNFYEFKHLILSLWFEDIGQRKFSKSHISVLTMTSQESDKIRKNWVGVTMDSKSNTSSVVQRKVTVQNVSIKDLEFDEEMENGDDKSTNSDEEQGLLKPTHKNVASSFQFKLRIETIMNKIQNMDYSPLTKVCWILITLYVMTEILCRIDDRTGILSGKTAAERGVHLAHVNHHMKEPIHPTANHGEGQPMNEIAPGLTVSEAKTGSWQQFQSEEEESHDLDLDSRESQDKELN